MDISIIIPVYNVEEYIERCILSVMNQMYSDISIECIIVDDNSPDQSIEKAKRLIEHYSGNILFRIVRHDKNCGLSSTRNTGMKNATGRYLYFLDSDDDIDNSCIHKLWNVVIMNPSIHMVMGNHLDHTGNKGIKELRIPNGIIKNYQLLELFFIGRIPVVAWNSLILRNIVINNNLSFKQGLLNEDVLWSLHLYSHIDSFFFLPDVTMNYNANPSSITSMLLKNKMCYLQHRIIIIEELLNSFNKDHWVANTLFIISDLLTVLDIIWKDCYNVDEKMISKINGYRLELFKMSLKEYRFILSLFELIMFKPFSYIMKLRFFRKNYIKIRYATYRFAMLFDILHQMR